jgi:hypothetical protein
MMDVTFFVFGEMMDVTFFVFPDEEQRGSGRQLSGASHSSPFCETIVNGQLVRRRRGRDNQPFTAVFALAIH